MVLAAVVWLAVLVYSEAHFQDCDHCNNDGPWWPLFKPSQLISSEFPEHRGTGAFRSQERRSYDVTETREEDEDVPHLVGVGEVGVSSGINSPVTTFKSDGKQQLEWDHFGDVGSVEVFRSSEAVTGMGGRSGENGISQEQIGSNILDHSKEVYNFKPNHIEMSDETSSKSNEAFFGGNSFFEDHTSTSIENHPGSFESSKEFQFSDEIKDSSNSVEHLSPQPSWYGGGARPRGPGATSYSAMTTMFNSPATAKVKDLLHTELPFNDISMYVKSQQKPVSMTKFFNGKNSTQQLLVHNPPRGRLGVLRYQQAPPLAPWAFHKVYAQPHSHTVLRWQEAPLRRVIHHESRVNHIVPTKNPFSDLDWMASKKIEYMKPPPLAKTLYLIRKKPNPLAVKKASHKLSQSHVYLMKNKRFR